MGGKGGPKKRSPGAGKGISKKPSKYHRRKEHLASLDEDFVSLQYSQLSKNKEQPRRPGKKPKRPITSSDLNDSISKLEDLMRR